jgi:hypothetical protein
LSIPQICGKANTPTIETTYTTKIVGIVTPSNLLLLKQKKKRESLHLNPVSPFSRGI